VTDPAPDSADPASLPTDRAAAWELVRTWSDIELGVAIDGLRSKRPGLSAEQRSTLTFLQATRDFREGNGPKPDGASRRW
jgi:hypothetical protein